MISEPTEIDTRDRPAPAAAALANSSPASPAQPLRPRGQARLQRDPAPALALLEKLFQLYPHLFGAEFLPLKLGVFQELLTRHSDEFTRETLKSALGVHTRSSRYLQSIAAGKPRHDLEGIAVEPVAPEHVLGALLELFRRRQGRSREDLRPKLRQQLMAAFETSGLLRQDYLALVHPRDSEAATLLDEAFAERDAQAAKHAAVLQAYANSGKTLDEFCDMYGLDQRDVNAAIAYQGTSSAPAAA